MSDQPRRAEWWQDPDGAWAPPEPTPGWSAPGAQSRTPGVADGAPTDEDPTAAPRAERSGSDIAGALLVVVGIVGGLAWAWELLRTQSADGGPGTVGARLDLLAQQMPLLLLSGAVAGIGIGLRTLAPEPAGRSGRSAVGRPVGRMLLAVAAAFVVFLAGAAIVGGGGDDDLSDLIVSPQDLPSVDIGQVIPIAPDAVADADGPTEPTHTLEVHSDGCGVFRSGEIGDDLTWVITDEDGFQVLGRNAAGETQYRYFRPGTYTVALEAWGGGYYVTVSNEVTITC